MSRVIGLGQVPVQLRRNGQAMKQGAQPLEELRPLLRGHSEPDPEPSGSRNQIGSDQEDPISHRPQPPFKPAQGSTVSRKPMSRL